LSRRAAGAGLRVEVVTAERPPDGLARRWHELAVLAENPFVLPEWHAAWVQANPAETPFVLVCHEAGGAVAGVVPLVLRGRRLLGPGEQLADWCGPACAPGDEPRVAAAVIDALARSKQRWDVWQLDRCRTGSAWIDALTRAARGSAVKLLPNRGEDVLVAVDLLRDGPDLTSGKKRRELERLGRRLREGHDVTLRRSTAPKQIERDLDVLMRWRAERWGGGFDAGQEAFVRTLAAALARLELLRLWVLDVDGAAAGVLLGWRLGARAFAYSQAFDPVHERLGVGMALLAHGVRDSAEEGCAYFDMLRGDEHFKGSFHISPDPVASYSAVRRRSLARLQAEALVGARAAYRRLAPERRERLQSARRKLRI
jgi:CelD/BcsL family acetyltransferase involved in cellulose biosynthesis